MNINSKTWESGIDGTATDWSELEEDMSLSIQADGCSATIKTSGALCLSDSATGLQVVAS